MLSITQSSPKAWQAHLKAASVTLGIDMKTVFLNADSWATENEYVVPDGEHYAKYLASLEETPPNPAIPAHVRRYVNHVLGLNADDDGSDVVLITVKVPPTPEEVPEAAVIEVVRSMPPKYMHRQGGRH